MPFTTVITFIFKPLDSHREKNCDMSFGSSLESVPRCDGLQLLVKPSTIYFNGEIFRWTSTFPQKISGYPKENFKSFSEAKVDVEQTLISSDVGLKSINIHQSGQCAGHLPGNQGYTCTDGATKASGCWGFSSSESLHKVPYLIAC